MRRALIALTLLLALVGCSGPDTTGVEPGEGPAATETAMHGDIPEEEGEPFPEEEPPAVAAFDEQVTYPDGVAVEVIRIKSMKLSRSGSTDGDVKPGSLITVLSIRVKNGSATTLDTYPTGTMSYGPDGEEAPAAFDTGIESAEGKILPGKAKTGTYGFVIPPRYLDDVTLEFSWDVSAGYESAIFSGSLK